MCVSFSRGDEERIRDIRGREDEGRMRMELSFTTAHNPGITCVMSGITCVMPDIWHA